MIHDDARTMTELTRPDPDEEKQFLRGSRDNPRELATAGRVFLEFVRGFENLGGLEAALCSGWVSEQAQTAAQAARQRFDSGETILVGLNRYPNASEQLPEFSKRVEAVEPDAPLFPPIKPLRFDTTKTAS